MSMSRDRGPFNYIPMSPVQTLKQAARIKIRLQEYWENSGRTAVPWANEECKKYVSLNSSIAVHLPDHSAIGGQDTFGKGRSVVGTICTSCMHLIAQAR